MKNVVLRNGTLYPAAACYYCESADCLEVHEDGDSFNSRWKVECISCGVAGPLVETKDEAAEAWEWMQLALRRCRARVDPAGIGGRMTTETKLEPCPVCGADLERVAETIQGIALRGCSSRVCAYVIIDLINGRDAHNTLARRAEIGRTLEQILTVNPGSLRVFAFEQWLTDENALDALRALASKLNITDETGGTTR